VQQPKGDWQKRNERTGEFMERKSSEGPFKGVAKEPDGRDTTRSPRARTGRVSSDTAARLLTRRSRSAALPIASASAKAY
jgi:hypothetical protein